MATLQDYRDERLRKLAQLKELGVDPYPADSHRTHDAGDITARFDELEGKAATVAGRIVGIRKFGKLAFIVLRDMSGQVQLFLHAPDVAELDAPRGILGMKELPLLDTGDFIEATGTVIRTKTGEISVGVSSLRLLTKALRPMPTELTDKEQRLRRRYVDMNVNQDVRQRFERRSHFWQATRQFLIDEGFLEINIPVLEGTAGGADATPFVTHMDALNQDFFLRISHELPLKRLLVAGYEKVFDIGARFRNENYSEEHLPEHVAMEWYWAYADWEQGMQLTERMIRSIVDKTWGTRVFNLSDGTTVDFGQDGEHFERISFVEILKSQYDIDVFESPIEVIAAALKKEGLEVEQQDNRQRSLDKLWKKYRKTIAGPVFLVDMPTFMQPLAKVQPDNPELTEQFNLVFGGSEMCKAFSELNDPVDQLGRFMEQQALRDAGDDEAQMLDIDYVEALEYAMPPACGLGFSERIFWSLEGVTAREGVPFPQLRSEIDEVTKSLYPDIDLGIQPSQSESSQ
jgi:lysyl-tRNA synthetase, class II